MAKHLNFLSIVLSVLFMSSWATACFASGSMMQQSSGTSQGTLKRHIDISSPWSGAYIYENSKVVGQAEVIESFTMDNLQPGSESGNEIETVSGSSNSQSGTGSSTRVLSENIETPGDGESMKEGFGPLDHPSWYDLF